MQGTTCDDGVIVFESCEICGYNDKYTHYGHELIKEHINVSEYGLCYGIFEREYCNVCGDTVYSREFSDCCYDENMTCYNCGVSKIENTEITELGGCKYKEDRIISYTINDEVIFSYEISDVDESHNIVENAIMNGNVCQFGYVLERYCDDCSYRENNTVGFDHLYAERTITVNQSDSCGLYVIKEIYCERCESLSHVEVLENNCEWETIEEDANSIYQCCTKCNVLYSNILYFDEETKLVYNYINYSFNGEELYYGIICYIGDAYPFSYVNDLNYEFTVGTYEIRSTNHDDNSVSSITFRANKDLLVSFDYYTSCEENCDYLLVCVNGEEIDKATGDDGNVKHLELNLSEGDTLSFRYCKDSSVNNGEDCAYIKNLTYTD